jgi:hypothetical protein
MAADRHLVAVGGCGEDGTVPGTVTAGRCGAPPNPKSGVAADWPRPPDGAAPAPPVTLGTPMPPRLPAGTAGRVRAAGRVEERLAPLEVLVGRVGEAADQGEAAELRRVHRHAARPARAEQDAGDPEQRRLGETRMAFHHLLGLAREVPHALTARGAPGHLIDPLTDPGRSLEPAGRVADAARRLFSAAPACRPTDCAWG